MDQDREVEFLGQLELGENVAMVGHHTTGSLRNAIGCFRSDGRLILSPTVPAKRREPRKEPRKEPSQSRSKETVACLLEATYRIAQQDGVDAVKVVAVANEKDLVTAQVPMRARRFAQLKDLQEHFFERNRSDRIYSI